nr:hypothetical protein [Propionibacterium sp.]
MLVFRAVSADELRALASGAVLAGAAWAVTPAFRDAFGLGPADDEDAERTVCCIAGLDALLRHGRRLVAVADAEARDAGGEFGAVTVDRLAFGQVTALFADDPAAGPRVDAVRAAVAGAGVEDAWEHPAHRALLEDADLLWYGPEEWGLLAAEPGA